MNYISILRAESDRIVTLASTNLDQPLVDLDWSVRDVCSHLGEVYATAAANVGSGTVDYIQSENVDRAEDADVLTLLSERQEALIAKLTHTPASAVGWTFHPQQQTAAFWQRRIAFETLIHRIDIETAVGEVTPIDPEVATDGVAEYFEVSLFHSPNKPHRDYPAGSLHIHRTDGPGEWTVRTDHQGRPVVTQEHAKGDAAVRGAAAELLLFVWGRPTGQLEIFGDESVAQAWQATAP